MEKIKSYEQLLEIIKNEKFFLLYVSMKNCSVCHVDKPIVEKIVTNKNIKSYNLEVEKVQEAVGQLSLFTAPVVILFFEGKEIHRQAKIIDFKELEYRISQINEII